MVGSEVIVEGYIAEFEENGENNTNGFV